MVKMCADVHNDNGYDCLAYYVDVDVDVVHDSYAGNYDVVRLYLAVVITLIVRMRMTMATLTLMVP